ncbi:MAG TPA: BlaI/MecI/CopY family transcriptional regulator [Candidatus Aphodomonas merdavium]|nr:BlaI/MecI/CopY family transcriptional regulator [Candidatus Aphodomonas merdavium]
MKSTRLPDAEFAVMEIIWELPAPVTIGQVREKLSEEKSWKLQTLVTLFGRLTERGFLRVDEKKRGREHLFYPTLTREEYLRMEMESFLGRYRQRRLPSLLAAFAGEQLTEKDLDELADFIRQARESGKE